MNTPPPLELVPILKTYAKCAWPGPITPPPLGSGGSRGGGGARGSGPPPFGPRCRLFNIALNLDPPFFACRPKMDPSGGSRVCVAGQGWLPRPPWNVDDVTRAMSKGGGGVLVNAAPAYPYSVPPIQVQTPPLDHNRHVYHCLSLSDHLD